MRTFLFSLFCLISLVSPSHAQVQPAEGTVLTGSVQIGSRQFALPPGEWTVMAVDEKPVTAAGIDKIGKYGLVYVVQTDGGNRFVAAMLYQSTFSSVGGVPSWTSEPCKRTDTLYRDTLDGNFNFPACLMVNHITNFWDPASKGSAFDAKIMAWYQDRKVQLPYTAVSSDYDEVKARDAVFVNSVRDSFMGSKTA